MSIKIMSAIFATDFRDLKDAAGTVTKASTIKLVMLALADHASENGEGAYPSLSKMGLKTKLARTTIVQAYKALMYNGIIKRVGRSKFRTSNYTIRINALSTTRKETSIPAGNMEDVPVQQTDQSSHRTIDGPAALPVQPLHQSSHPTIDSPATLPSSVQPLDLNHPLTTLKPSNVVDESKTATAMKNLTHLYETTIGAITPLMADLLRNAAIDFPPEWFEPAFEVAVKNNARRWIYIESILDGWKRNGFGWKPVRAAPSRAASKANDAFTALQNYIEQEKNGRQDRDRKFALPFFDIAKLPDK